jgi:hypothetical protein
MQAVNTIYLSLYNLLIYLSSRDVVVPGQGHVKVPLIISEIEINFATII